MSNTNSKNKQNLSLNDYLFSLYDKISNDMHPVKKIKDETECFYIPKFKEYDHLRNNNYNLNKLKVFAKHYKLLASGNKQQITNRIYSYLFLSNLAVKIQKIVRGRFQRSYFQAHGPAFKNRSLCTNTIDFLSMENVTEITKEQFYSFKDEDGFIYGFDLLSFHNLVYKSNGIIKNPFSTKPISAVNLEGFKIFLRLSKLLNIDICTELADITKSISSHKSVELRAVSLFQNIDALGNYSNVSWFMSLNKIYLIKFLRELADIWSYRAPLTLETKISICPPLGNPFSRLHTHNLQTMENVDDIRNIILDILEKMVNTGIDKDSKCLGAFYVLGALTLVNHDAATSLPWLFQSLT
jgi:hypothetical protein